MPKNILYVDSYFGIGGGQKSMLAIIEGLDRTQYLPVLTIPKVAPLCRIAQKMGIKTIETSMGYFLIETKDVGKNILMSFMGFLQLIRTWAIFYKIISEGSFSLIHTNSIKATLMVGIPALFLSKPVVCHIRHQTGHGVLDKIATCLTTRIVTVSDFVKSEFSRIIGKESKKIIRIYNGIDLSNTSPKHDRRRLCQKFSIPPQNHLVGIVGRLLPWKGHKMFIKAIPIIVKELPQTTFLIVGDIAFSSNEPYKKELLELCQKLGVTDNVVFTGFRDDVFPIISSLDVLVNASENEPLARVVLEGLSLGTPVVATRSGGSPEIIKDGRTGFLVPVNDSNALAKMIIKMIKNPKLTRSIVKNGKKVIAQKFSKQTYVRNIESLYESIIKS